MARARFTWMLGAGLAFSLAVTSGARGEDKFFEIRARKFSYTPNMITVNKGDTVRIRLLSEDVSHGFYLDGYGVETSAHPGRDGNLRFVADKAGRFSFRCSVTCGEFHPYMIGNLVVSPNVRFWWGVFFAGILGAWSLLVSAGTKDGPITKLFGVIPLNWRFELTAFKPIRALFKSRWFPLGALIFNVALFTVILLAFLLGGHSAGNYNFGVMIVWILWYTVLMVILVPFVGRLWCLMCPFPLFGDWFQRGKLVEVGSEKSRGLNKRWPSKWLNLWPLVILFFISTWFAGFFTVRPIASFVFIGVVVLCAFITALIFGKRTFCLVICPVSGFQGLYANFSMAEVRVKNPEICKKHTPKTCCVGNEKGYGCPWMELPYEMNRNTYCGLCLECFKTCPYDNMAFNLRPFGTDFLSERRRTDDVRGRRGLDEAFKAITMIGIFFSFFVAFQSRFTPVRDMIRAKTFSGFLSYIAETTMVDFVLLPGSLLIFVLLSKLASGNKEISLKKLFVNFSYCLVPLGVLIWAGFACGIILPNGSYILHILSDPFAWGWDLIGTRNAAWTPILTRQMPYIQITAVLLGLLFALEYGFKFARQTFPTLEQAKRGWLPIALYLVLLTIGGLWLFAG